jgi:hypothetical protein
MPSPESLNHAYLYKLILIDPLFAANSGWLKLKYQLLSQICPTFLL